MCETTQNAETALPDDVTAARQARAFVRATLCARHDHDRLDRALLLVSELTVNAVEHGRPPVSASLDFRGELLRIQVTDGSPQRPVHRAVLTSAENGRGVALVDALSARWGVRPTGSGKTVWCDVTV
ncbi:MAG: ATP-binding protein [Janthinobacterium lividum]